MKITSTDKDAIFEVIKTYFSGSYEDVDDVFDDFSLYELGFQLWSGATKFCIYHKNFDNFVVKVTSKTEAFDWCEREYTNYLAAVERGLGEFFPYTDFLGEFGDTKFFIQEYCECDEDSVFSILYSKVEEDYPRDENESDAEYQESIYQSVDDLEDDMRVVYIFGLNEELLDFLGDYCINDLHSGNFGWLEGHYVIIDFSGYGLRAQYREF